MPFPTPRYSSDPSRRLLQRAADSTTLSMRPGRGVLVAKTGNHWQVSAKGGRRGGGSGTTLAFYRLTAIDFANKTYTGTLQKRNPAAAPAAPYIDTSPAVTRDDIREARNFIGIEVGGASSIVAVTGGVFTFVLPRVPFEVDLEQTGGANGTSTAAATWTYSAKMVGTANVLGTTLSPIDKGHRLSKGLVAVATKGMGQYTAAGVFELAMAYERHGSNVCT